MNGQLTDNINRLGLTTVFVLEGGATNSGQGVDMRESIRQLPGGEEAQTDTVDPDWIDSRLQSYVELAVTTDITQEKLEQLGEAISTLRPEQRRIFQARMSFRKEEMRRLEPSFMFEGPDTLPDA